MFEDMVFHGSQAFTVINALTVIIKIAEHIKGTVLAIEKLLAETRKQKKQILVLTVKLAFFTLVFAVILGSARYIAFTLPDLIVHATVEQHENRQSGESHHKPASSEAGASSQPVTTTPEEITLGDSGQSEEPITQLNHARKAPPNAKTVDFSLASLIQSQSPTVVKFEKLDDSGDYTVIDDEHLTEFIAELKRRFGNSGSSKFLVVGLADTSGEKAYNHRIANRRTEIVTNLLHQELGESAEVIPITLGEYAAALNNENSNSHAWRAAHIYELTNRPTKIRSLTITIETNGQKGSGTDADVYLYIGNQPFTLNGSFERGKTESIELAADALSREKLLNEPISIGHNNGGLMPRWSIRTLTLEAVDEHGDTWKRSFEKIDVSRLAGLRRVLQLGRSS